MTSFLFSQKYFEAMTQICAVEILNIVINEKLKINRSFEIVDVIKELAPPMKDFFSACYFDNTLRECSEMFTETLTEDGLCYTFNIANSDQIFDKKS